MVARAKRPIGKRDQFAPELVYFSDCVLNGRVPGPSAEEGLIDVRIIEAIQESAAHDGRSVRVGILLDEGKPDMRQEIRRPAVRAEPKLVKVASASEE